ncbi:MlaD family protein [Magnetospirillum aberrantis]|uniref:MCE family protein n=1 Tax=Magnetospirillum aberrantis SpK TaxID=908842 RepID=A0A7C9UX17_9PROT|nr:MlaD family protein [Magnetospirillum aberrantis]NFV82006.1 MCE family protein [Magnetospirillum aberrantis SpK]
MKDVRINYVIVGGFVAAMLVALLVVVALLTGRTGTVDTYVTRLNNVQGVKFGTKVTYEGFVVGQVDDIVPLREDGRTSFRVVMAVREHWPIPEGSVARVAAPGILAAMTVDIKGGGSERMLEPGAEIPGGPAANIFATMNEMAGQVAVLNQQGLLPLLANINQRVDSLGSILEKQAPDLLANLVAISSDLAVKAPRITADVQKMTGTLSSQVVTEANAARVAQTLDNLAELTAGLKDSRAKVDSVLTTLDGTVQKSGPAVEASLKDLRYILQSVARNIDSITYNLENTSRNFNEFSRQLRENPGVLIGGTKAHDDGSGRR